MATQKSTIKKSSNGDISAEGASSPLNAVDFKKLIPDHRYITVGGETFDVAIIPVATTLKMSDALTFSGVITSKDMVTLTAEVLAAARPDLKFVNEDWLTRPDICDGVTLMRIVDFVMKPAADLFFPSTNDSKKNGEENGQESDEEKNSV